LYRQRALHANASSVMLVFLDASVWICAFSAPERTCGRLVRRLLASPDQDVAMSKPLLETVVEALEGSHHARSAFRSERIRSYAEWIWTLARFVPADSAAYECLGRRANLACSAALHARVDWFAAREHALEPQLVKILAANNVKVLSLAA
jgi:hypothetical protein